MTASTGIWLVVASTAEEAAVPVGIALAAALTAAVAAAGAARRAGQRRLLGQSDVRQRLVDVLEGWPEIQLNGLAGSARSELDASLADLRGAMRTIDRSVSLATLAIGLLSTTVLGVTAAVMLADSAAPTRVAVASGILLAILGLREVLSALADAAVYAGPATAAMRRLGSMLGDAPRRDTAADQPWPAAPALHLQAVVACQESRHEPLDLTAEPGALVLVTGPSGSGKTTLLQVLAGQMPPAEGLVLVDGTPMDRIDPAIRSRRICLVPQETVIFSGTVADNLRIAAPDATDDELLAALACVGLADHVGQLAAGLRQSVGLRGERLSGGQARRITLARAVLRRPDILLLDEPTAGLDEAIARAMLSALRDQLPQTTLVAALHGQVTTWLPEEPAVTVRLIGRHAALDDVARLTR